MININLRGRTGNQLFIYALARKIQLDIGDTICINTTMQNKEYPSFSYDLGLFNVTSDMVLKSNEKFPWYVDNDNCIIKLFRKLFPRFLYNLLSKYNCFLWLEDTYVDLEVIKGRNCFIDGFWQSPRYFDSIKKVLREELTPCNEISGYNKELLYKIRHTDSVCVTIRRGDYIENEKIKKKYFLCDEKYFNSSIAKMRSIRPECKWFVFSDDVDWVRDNYSFPGEVYFESGNDNVSEKLYLMANCNHFIISNSSFSWWAQYLGAYDDKVVIAPSRWYSDNRKCDIYESTWITVEV